MRVISLVLMLLLPAVAHAAPPEVRYVKGGAQKLIFVNNPEQLCTQDLGDRGLGNAVVLTLALAPGGYRDFFEHVNLTGKTIGYGVQLYNPNPRPVTVRIHGAGYVSDSNGGRPWVQLFNGYSAAGVAHVIPPFRVLWVLRRDSSVPDRAFFSGVVDFSVSGGPLFLHNYAYRAFANLDGTARYMGYVQRIGWHNNHNEARVYKGLSAHSEAVADGVDFVISDTDHGELPVRHPSYDLASGSYGPPKVRAPGWYTNIGPAMNADAVAADMVSLETPGWGVIDPLSRSDGTGDYPNLGNWGVVYRLSGTVTNVGSYTRKLSINLKAPPCNVVIAYRHGQGPWKEYHLKPSQYIQYSWITAPPTGQPVSYQASYVVGGPACGNLMQAVAVNN